MLTVQIKGKTVELDSNDVREYMEFFLCSREDALFCLGCEKLGMSTKEIVDLLRPWEK